MILRDFITEAKITLNDLYQGNFPDRDEIFWDEVRSDELDVPFEVQALPKHKLQITLLSQYRAEHIDEIVDMLDEDQQEILEKYINDPLLSDKIIVMSGGRIIDGNHRALAAAVKGVPIKYIDVAEDEEIDERMLSEGATPVLYHKTSVRAALEVITSGEFKLTSSIGNKSESDMAPAGYPYYLSATRSKVGDYHRWVGSSAVMFVLDGARISQRYLVKPVDYWERSWQGTQDRTRESEDRIFSRRNTMPSDYITEVHVLLSEQDDLRSEEVRKLLIAAKTKNIPTYLYTDQESWRLQNKRKAKTAGEVGDLLKGGRREPAYMGRPVRGQGRGDDAYGRSDILSWIELIKKQPGQTLSKRADKLRYNLQYYNDEGKRLANYFFNAKKPDSPEYPLVVKLGDWMTSRQLDFNSLSELLKNKWKSQR